jgi:hypothetical protein
MAKDFTMLAMQSVHVGRMKNTKNDESDDRSDAAADVVDGRISCLPNRF